MSLSQILSQIESHKPMSELDLTEGPATTYGARRGAKMAAVESIKRLKDDYKNELKASTIFVVVTGTARNAFCEATAAGNFDSFTVDAENLYKDLIGRIDPKLFGREKTHHLFTILSAVLHDKAIELGLAYYNPLSYSDKYAVTVNKPEDLLSPLKAAFNEQVGAELVGIDAIHSIVDEAIEKKHKAEITCVFLNAGDEKLALDLNRDLKRLTSKVFLLAAGKTSKQILMTEGVFSVKNVSEESVISTLKAINSKV